MAVDSYLKLLRRPADLIVGLLPGKRSGAGAAARIAVDRADATARAGLSATLGVDLHVDAERRQAAADERDRAVNLRRKAQEQEVQAEVGVENSNRQAAQRRDRARTEAGARRRSATKKQETRTRQATEAKRRRTQASREQEAKAEEQIAADAAREQLPAVEAQAEALQERQQAGERREEAERLGAAAARVKDERKEATETEPANGAGPV
jgi:colicin import membrane protein